MAPEPGQPPGSFPVELESGTWEVDPARSQVGFVARQFLVAKVKGRFTSFRAALSIDPGARRASVVGEVDTASIDTRDRARDDHLRSRDFFDVERWPVLRLSGDLVGGSDRSYQVACEMTIRDVTQPVAFDVVGQRFAPEGDGPPLLRLRANATVSRREFGLRWSSTIETGGVVVADQVELILRVEAAYRRG